MGVWNVGVMGSHVRAGGPHPRPTLDMTRRSQVPRAPVLLSPPG